MKHMGESKWSLLGMALLAWGWVSMHRVLPVHKACCISEFMAFSQAFMSRFKSIATSSPNLHSLIIPLISRGWSVMSLRLSDVSNSTLNHSKKWSDVASLLFWKAPEFKNISPNNIRTSSKTEPGFLLLKEFFKKWKILISHNTSTCFM